MKIHRQCTTAVIGALVVTMAHQAGAAGFAVQEKSVAALGRAFAGNSLPGDDASSAFYNPADMVNLEDRTMMQVGVTYVMTDINVEGTYSNSLLPVPISETGSGNSDEDVVIPNFSLVTPISEFMSFGLSINAPFGLATDYGEEWFSRYATTLAELKVIDINPSLSFKISDDFSVGFGLSYQYVEAELNQRIQRSALAASLFSNGTITSGQIPSFISGTDGYSNLEGDDWSWGYNLGLTWSITDNLVTSLAYRSEVHHKLDGDQVTSGYTAGGALAPTLNGSVGGEADLDLPQSVNISTMWTISEKWDVMASAIWTGWSSFEELRVELDNGSVTTEEQNWRNVWAFAIGAAFKMSDTMDLRFGYQYDPTPIGDDDDRSARIPDTDRDFFTVGLGWHLSENMTIDAAYGYLLGESVDMMGETSQGDFDGEVKDSEAHLIGVQFQYKM